MENRNKKNYSCLKKWMFLLFLCFTIPGAAVEKRDSVHHAFQLGLEAGLGDISAGGTQFPFGTTLGGFCRYRNHVIGVRRDYYSKLQIFQAADYYKCINLYYAYAIERRYTSISAQMGLGIFETNLYRPASYNGIAAEISADATVHARGNGIGVRFFYNFNGKVNYAGLAFHATLGWAWN